jgi:hypothetical protein
MGMKQTLEVINAMEADGLIGRYAVAGAVAAYNYIEPTVTDDVDILISFNEPTDQLKPGLVTLAPIFAYLKMKGYAEFLKEGLVIEDWTVQFLPVANDLDAEALAHAQEVEIRISETEGSVWTREYIVAICLRVGRPKDLIRITQFLEENTVDFAALCQVLGRHNLKGAWRAFCRRMGIADPCRP